MTEQRYTAEEIEEAKDAKAFAVDNEIETIRECGTMQLQSAEAIYNQATLNAQANVLYYAEQYDVNPRLLLGILEGKWFDACKHNHARTFRYSKNVHGKSGYYRVCSDCCETLFDTSGQSNA